MNTDEEFAKLVLINLSDIFIFHKDRVTRTLSKTGVTAGAPQG
jgi:hypothetical protein